AWEFWRTASGADQPARRSIGGGPGSAMSADDQERQHFRKILAAFRHYRRYGLQQVTDKLAQYNGLPERHKRLMGGNSGVPEHLARVRASIEHNAEMINLFIADANSIFDGDSPLSPCAGSEGSSSVQHQQLQVTSNDMDKVRSTIKQFARDWSLDGANERALCYEPMLREIDRLFPAENCPDRSEVRVLVPGAGLGRLAWEVARLGFSCQGNEWSLYMLFCSYFVINRCSEPNCFTLYPWVHQFCNNWSWADQLRPITFPDVSPADLPKSGSFSMAAGDFLEIYTEPEAWDCVATVFFIDTAHNIAAYVETIGRILKPGGYWINLGPLLYHFADVPGEASIELDYATLRQLVLGSGFELLTENTDIRCGYTQNEASMLRQSINYERS
ncbi:hypothetical protein BOX15_Mlig014030g1, partial [Macrostomum lignano]